MSHKVPGAGKVTSMFNSLSTAGREYRKRRWQRRDNPAGRTMPAFLVGNVRSGTSMIVYHIAKSWQVLLFNEDNPKAFELWRLRDFGVIDGLLSESQARVTLFKPILDTYRTKFILDRYPAGKVLFAFRHYSDVINSSRNRFYDKSGKFTPSKKVPDHDPRDPVEVWVSNDFLEYSDAPLREESKNLIKGLWQPNLSLESLIALRWLLTNRLFFDLELFADDRVMIINYEDTVTAPEVEFKKIFQFLNLDYHYKVIEGIFSSSVGKDVQPDLDPAIRQQCDELFSELVHFTRFPEKR
ncbi:MAG TPA: hypothetical protein VJ768_04205 [Anaerolineales bacterium]|nr:hypothetical protein [Anaerolineales bacterium]